MDIEQIKAEIVARLKPLNPEKVILFGSCARGEPEKDSDIDLYVVTNDTFMPKSWREKSDVHLKVINQLDDIQKTLPVYAITHTVPMLEKFVELDSMFSREVFRDGVRLL